MKKKLKIKIGDANGKKEGRRIKIRKEKEIYAKVTILPQRKRDLRKGYNNDAKEKRYTQRKRDLR